MDKTLDDKIDTILASQGVATIEAQTVRALGGSKEDMERAMNHSFNMAKDDIKNLITQEAAAARADQIEQDFLQYSLDLDVDESELIRIRNTLVAELSNKGKNK